jgi:hypothetical protein
MAVGADRAKILNRVYLVFHGNGRQRVQMVDMNNFLEPSPEHSLRTKAANYTCAAVVGEADTSRFRIALKATRQYGNRFSLAKKMRKAYSTAWTLLHSGKKLLGVVDQRLGVRSAMGRAASGTSGFGRPRQSNEPAMRFRKGGDYFRELLK